VALGGWIGEVLANLRLYLVVGSVLVAGSSLLLPLPWRRRLALFAAGVGLATIHIVVLLPYIARSPPAALRATGEGVRLRLLSANLDSWAVDLPALEKLLRASRADIVLLTEITFAQQRVFQSVRDIYPQQFETPLGQDNTFIVRILARRPMEIALFRPVARDYAVLHARFCSSGERCLTSLSAHAPRPGPERRETRNAVLGAIAGQAKVAAARGDRVVAAGDFNITAFSPDFTVFAGAGLADTALGRGYPST
jgi:endonuclease/exonuclease/phosphatase (EEP) superfamily protein YafD